MLLSQVEAFLLVARLGHVGRASASIGLSQPALSARIQALESEVGATLFERTPRGMSLTSSGFAFLPHAERAILALQDGLAFVSDIGEGLAGELIIGAAPAISTYVLPDILARYVTDRPHVRLTVRTGHSEEIIEMVVRGEVHLGLARESSDRRVVTEMLYEDELVLVAHPSDSIARQDRFDLAATPDTRLIVYDGMSSYYELTAALLRDVGFGRSNVMELDNIAAAKRMVEHGLGVALLPAVAVSDALASGALCRIRWAGSDHVHRRVMLVLRRNRAPDLPAAAALHDLLRRIPEIIPGARAIP